MAVNERFDFFHDKFQEGIALKGGLFPAADGVWTVAKVLCWLCAAMTVISGGKYFMDNRHFIAETK